MPKSVRSTCAVALFLLSGAACEVSSRHGALEGTARDEWRRSYTLETGGELQLTSPNGSLDVEAVEGNTVEVTVERIAHASDDEAAAEIVPRITIKEEVAPDKIVVRTESLGGIVIGVRIETNYHVRAPKASRLRLRGTGNVTVKGFSGRVIANAINGKIAGEDLSGGVEARSVNGDSSITMAAVTDLVDVRATNGNVALTIPDNANANLSVSITNGQIDTSALTFEPLGADQTRRRVRGKINAGGVPIELNAVNGNVVVNPR
jgi:hypothetical protein